MQLILISNSTNFTGEFDLLQELFDSGLEVFHVRKPDFSEIEIRSFLDGLPPSGLDKVVLHSHYYLAEEYGVRGLHYRPHNMGFKANKFDRFSQSASCHSFDEVGEAEKLGMDYVFLSPVFDSISKSGYRSEFQASDLREFLSKPVGTKIIALSGVHADNVDDCLNMGFDGAAVLGAVWQSGDPVKAFLNIQRKCWQSVNQF